MAHQTSVTLVDDLDGGKAAETVVFGLDGASYEIDLSKKNADRSASARNQKRPVPRKGPSSAVVREWAAAQGVAVSPRGRISADVVAQYEGAQPG